MKNQEAQLKLELHRAMSVCAEQAIQIKRMAETISELRELAAKMLEKNNEIQSILKS